MLRALGLALALVSVVGAASVRAAPGKAHHRAHHARHARHAPLSSRFEAPSDATSSPAYRYGTMSPADCQAELTARQISFVPEPSPGVAAPVRLTGPLHGVTFHAQVEAKDQATTPYEIADFSLVLALDDFSQILADHDVVLVEHYSMYRPPSSSWPDGQIAKQHAGAVAIDAAHFVKRDGKKLSVLDDFHGKIGAKTCGDGAGPAPATADAVELRAILCEAVSRHLFNVVLTPDFNKPHRNHFHLEVTSGVTWFLVH